MGSILNHYTTWNKLFHGVYTKMHLYRGRPFNPQEFFVSFLHSLSVKAQTRMTLMTLQRSEATCLLDGCCNQWSGWQHNWHTKASVGSNTCRNWYFLLAADVPLFIIRQTAECFQPQVAAHTDFLPVGHYICYYILMFNIWISHTLIKFSGIEGSAQTLVDGSFCVGRSQLRGKGCYFGSTQVTLY